MNIDFMYSCIDHCASVHMLHQHVVCLLTTCYHSPSQQYYSFRPQHLGPAQFDLASRPGRGRGKAAWGILFAYAPVPIILKTLDIDPYRLAR